MHTYIVTYIMGSGIHTYVRTYIPEVDIVIKLPGSTKETK